MLEGTKIYLQPLTDAHVTDEYCSWMNDAEVVKYTESRFSSFSKKSLCEYVNAIAKDKRYVFFGIFTKDGKEHIGNIKLGPVNLYHKYADIGLIIGKKKYWGRGIATDAIRVVSNYAFNVLGIRKLTAGCYANNVGAIRAFERAGFSIEGVLEKHYLSDEELVDRICLSMHKN